MRRALELAALGSGQVSPNPMVGCVLVHQNKIIGEGWHKKYGDWHAEVNAVNAVDDKALLRESTAYVTLEPCSHFGKTPPCADLLIKHQLKKAVICNVDSNPLVGGKGIQKLQQAGIDIQTGVLEKEGRELNKRFFTYMEQKRPYIILKWAQTADGLVAREDYSSKWISNSISRTLVHSWRASEDAIMVGTQTALYDNPQLTVRDWSGTDPVRIVIDKSLRLPSSLHMFDKKVLTLCYNTLKTERQDNLEFIKLADSPLFLEEIIQDLYARKIQSVIIEGGSKLLNSFIELRLWDEARVFKSSQVFSKGIAAPLLQSQLHYIQAIQDDTLFIYKNPLL
ncbi:bifunctional diaminohydroxyphosphoribosylaminopyrimidine deaminase/5-amino-6-(5-phosphoribosylamino)uracil reductase RibD [Rhodocytophaga aerolata]|uniref:Riboflavin biosynthesis protein RibD n=1 Tax=Rhodocytophaga aerolata TaxID=455078 RepID=A0ABT8R9P1_9BACT|nr:bifunctional diaminohydroxyphosphoribosylaminopyrimidine deaminase/5-amino-6-(5-phosphoribosylamino)uracil reductase RibD [Rhodocytophaga aerolata]MDO1448817.1 bifunctional diaminohydroxyphosphoribosylaminopyrimidine deaminase/5-amino-6-(5-phosphoribosylamino)uracil reductase RibD [Rhodocytophaga aerolata]